MRVDFTSQDGQIDPFWTLWMTSVIESEEETIFINRITAGSASRVCKTTHLIYQPQRRSSKLRENQVLLQKRQIYPSSNRIRQRSQTCQRSDHRSCRALPSRRHNRKRATAGRKRRPLTEEFSTQEKD